MKKIKLIEQSGYMFIASYGEIYQVSDEDYNKIISPKYKTTLTDGVFLFTIDENIITAEKEAKIIGIEKQMKQLRANRDGLAELIEFGAEATGDRERLEQITEAIQAKAMERKALYNQS